MGHLDEAFAHYDQARQAYAKLAGRAGRCAMQDRLAASLSNLAAVEHARGNTEAALELYGSGPANPRALAGRTRRHAGASPAPGGDAVQTWHDSPGQRAVDGGLDGAGALPQNWPAAC